MSVEVIGLQLLKMQAEFQGARKKEEKKKGQNVLSMNYWVQVMPSSTCAWRIIDDRELASKLKMKVYMETIYNMKNV